MSSALPLPEQQDNVRPRRVLACVLCQQRKVKCDKKFPCENCVKGNAQCIPATATGPGQRRRRFPERELLDRLRYYEELLRQNNIQFEPLHGSTAGSSRPDEGLSSGQIIEDDGQPANPASEIDRSSSQKTTIKSEPVNFWRALSKKNLGLEVDDDSGESDNDILGENRGLSNAKGYLHRAGIRKAWNRTFSNKDSEHLLLGSSPSNVDLATLHPEQAKVFKLWQIYLDNVDPILKVTHSPTLQARIIDALGDITAIDSALEALMFSIYCVSILTLDENECRSLFGLPRNDLLSSYQFACRQALQNCHFLRTSDRDCLTALFLYLISVRSETDPRSMSSMFGIVIRTAKRMSIHDESSYTKCAPLEAEMRRRLWWSIVNFDNRICEMFDHQNSTLSPTWNCKILLNVNDFEFRAEMKTTPTIHGNPTEAIFAVVRSELGDCVRHSLYHLDFINPLLRAMVKGVKDLDALEKRIEATYLAHCNPENPLHFMTIWWARSYIAKCHLMEYYSRSTEKAPIAQGTRITVCALRMLQYDTKLMTSPLSRGYRWFIEFHFPFPAYMHVIQRLKARPDADYADEAWRAMSENYEARIMNEKRDKGSLIVIFSAIVLQAWEAREVLFRQQGKQSETPRIVTDLRSRQKPAEPFQEQGEQSQTHESLGGLNIDDFPPQMDTDAGMPYGNGTFGMMSSASWGYPNISGHGTTHTGVPHFDWTSMDWTYPQGT
ncbi:C6 zinc finger domain protein [Truncatella angustata]|uniref:C6 zinc finger domain protein n=1 Tax=Truncatella angustata TaxID=152316 RepID=A0A9P8UYW7_9PEZI|nr:C6 zinc finger domain protein [Truncatella angustata]KAH6660546.1 C6 zinc finger domain protein [Truncatella angustata]